MENSENKEMTIKIRNTQITEVKIPLPHYRMNECFAYKVFDSSEYEGCLQICIGTHVSPSIRIAQASLAWEDSTKECSESEFMEKFNKTIERLKSIAL